jgi:hypothetical protein
LRRRYNSRRLSHPSGLRLSPFRELEPRQKFSARDLDFVTFIKPPFVRLNFCDRVVRADTLERIVVDVRRVESSARAIAVLCIFSFSATAAIFLILELGQPFTGMMMISDQALRNALPAMNL